ncbi:MAG TPA: PQQ-binding-like beta-propeller repeat protein [Ktedonobacteraceae bacterium]|nr:PQQ-binding-like beta-propeller repeat protein [Ktedonobacteraceae bacterium]
MLQSRRLRQSALILPFLIQSLLVGLTACSDERCMAQPVKNPGLLSANGLIYLNSPSSNSLYALNGNNGSTRWTYQASGDTLLDQDILYINDNYPAYTVTALNASYGTKLWQKDTREGMYVGKLVAAIDHIAYIAKDNGMLEAVNGRDGSVIWQHVLKADPSASMTDDPSLLEVVDGVVYVSTVNSSVFALREHDGKLLWQYNTTQGDRLNELKSSVMGDGMIFISADQTYALRMGDGKLLWRLPQKGGLFEAAGILYLHVSGVFDTAREDSLSAFSANDGKQVWSRSLKLVNSLPGQVIQEQSYEIHLIDNVLYVLTYSYTNHAFEHISALKTSDGTPLWDRPLQKTWRASLASSQGIVYLFSVYGLDAFHEADGSSVWSHPLQQEGLLITNDSIYVGTAGNTTFSCYPTTRSQLEKLSLSNASHIWNVQLDSAPDTSLPVEKIVLFILGSLLSFLGLLGFFVLSKRHRHGWPPQSHQEGTALIVPAVSAPRIKSIGWLLLFIPGAILLLIAATMAT